MALFGRKKEEEKKDVVNTEASTDAKKEVKEKKQKVSKKTAEKVEVTERGRHDKDLSRVLLRPRITEKAAVVGDQNVYTFEVDRKASKYDVRDAVKELFKVTSLKVNIVNRQPRTFMSRARNRKGVHPGMKKAYIYLKKDDRIDLV